MDVLGGRIDRAAHLAAGDPFSIGEDTEPSPRRRPRKPPPPPFVVWVDTREQRPPPFPPGVEVVRVTMDAADYTTEKLQGYAVIERKSPSDFAGSITHGRERFDDEIRRLDAYRWKAIIVEGTMADVYAASRVHPHSVIGTVASFLARHDLPVLFAEGGYLPGDVHMTSEVAAGRLIVGVLRRWEERKAAEEAAPAEGA